MLSAQHPTEDPEGWVLAQAQDCADSTQGPPAPPGWPCAPGPDRFPRIELGVPLGPSKKVWGLLSKGKQLLRKLGSGKKE
ncbi:hypothetical protein Cadr_000018946 [Camelus dromedarius]|uniref:Uncharacterized protein n=1 Tax=Camelus dromedarius TaxID=9838 RepID=A0A5N4D1H2_CAMDR|nr:hypothetical protein Cadr_000018946 [Camelus dromedarius]